MKKLSFLILFLLFVQFEQIAANNLKWYDFNEGVAKAKKEKKMILIDFYTDWCVYCKKMDKETYSDYNVIKYLNENFVLVKINPEKQGTIKFRGSDYNNNTFARIVGVNGYPATLFMDYDEELITLVPGFIPSSDFLNIVKFLGGRYYKTMKYDEFLKHKKQ